MRITDVVSAQTPCDEKKATAFWKDENALKTLIIYQWKQHYPVFESSVIRNDIVWKNKRGTEES